jgi:NTP pyrophosphatase (non-canonical NTP hydrolase)
MAEAEGQDPSPLAPWPKGYAGYQVKTLALPKLQGLRPTLESTALKLMEEAGELGAAIGKYRGLSGETPLPAREALRRVAQELLDVAQTAITMMFVLEETYGIDVADVMRAHLEKLARRGYLTAPKEEGAPHPAPEPSDAGSVDPPVGRS